MREEEPRLRGRWQEGWREPCLRLIYSAIDQASDAWGDYKTNESDRARPET